MFAASVEFDMSAPDFDLDAIFKAEDYARDRWNSESDAGTGFGFRDVTFYVEDEATAWDVIEFMRAVGCCNDRIYELED